MFISTKKFMVGASVLAALSFSTTASATVYDFDLLYNGGALSLDVGSDDPIGASLVDGDSFDYNIQATGTDFWNVDVGGNFFPFLAFTIAESGDRVGDMTLSLLLDGVEQFSLAENGISNSFVHLGTNGVNLLAGLMFDEIILTYDLITSVDDVLLTPNNATITHYTIGSDPLVPGGFSSADISYIRAPINNVPEPGLLGLMALSLFGIGFAVRRAKRSI